MGSKFWGASLAALVGMAAAQPLAAQDVHTLATKFGARESVRDIALSPDGKQVLMVAPTKTGGEIAVVVPVGGETIVPVLSSSERDMLIQNCHFVLDTRVACSLARIAGSNKQTEALDRMVAVGTDGKDMVLLTQRASSNARYQVNAGGDLIDYRAGGERGSVLMSNWVAEESSTATLTGHKTSGLGVDRVDVMTGRHKQVEPPRLTATEYYSDGLGRVRMMELQNFNDAGYREDEIKFKVRVTPDAGWTDFTTLKIIEGNKYVGFMPVMVEAESNYAYGFQSKDGYKAVYRRALAGGEPELVFAKDGVDVDTIMTMGPTGRVVGASFATDKRSAVYFDPKLQALQAALSKALGGRAVDVVAESDDETKMIIRASSDVDPGTYYLFDSTTKQLAVISPSRPELADVKLAPMKPITFPGPDGTMIPGYLTMPLGSEGKKVPAIVMPHGGPSSRDEWGFDWLVQFYAARGFAVLQPNYRGSSGYGSNWFQKNGFQSWESAIGDINAAGKWLVSSGVTTAEKLAIVGWSYGGFAALQSAVVDPDLFKAIVAVAPVTDLERLKLESLYQTNRRQVEAMIGSGEHIDAASPARHAERITAPVLLVHGDADFNVAVGQSRLMNDKLKAAGKDVSYIEFPDLMHSLDDAAARTRLLEESDALLRRALKL